MACFEVPEYFESLSYGDLQVASHFFDGILNKT